MTTQPITTALFDFLRDLRENNDREWFAANKGRYLAEVRDPMLDFIGAFAAPLAEISPHFVADPRPNGGSLFRIYRDTRFSRDKTPYKTNAGAHFRHAAGKDAHAPGFYLHLEPGMCFAGCGVWRPDGPTVTKIREAIDGERDAWTRVTTARDFTETFELEGDSLKRPPRGYEAGPPAGGGPEAQGLRRGYELFGGRSGGGRTFWTGSRGSRGEGRRLWSFCRGRWGWGFSHRSERIEEEGCRQGGLDCKFIAPIVINELIEERVYAFVSTFNQGSRDAKDSIRSEGRVEGSAAAEEKTSVHDPEGQIDCAQERGT